MIVEQLSLIEHGGSYFKMLLVSKAVYYATLPAVYRSVEIRLDAKVLGFCQTIRARPESHGILVKRLHLRNSFPIRSPDNTKKDLIAEASNALLQMPNLEDFLVYGFNICEAVTRLCNDLPFALRSLTVLPSGEQMTSDFRHFVRAQSSITHLALDAHYTHCFDISYFSDSDLLPNLTSLISCCRVFSVLAPGRPITQAVIQRCSKHPNRDTDIANFRSALNQTIGPLMTLYIDAWGQRVCGKNGWDLLKNVKSTKACSTLLHLTLEEWPSVSPQPSRRI